MPCCLATASEERYLRPALERLGLAPYFAFIVYRGDLPVDKGDPEYYRLLAARFGAAPDRLTVFEDSLYAIRSAKEAGCRTVALYDRAADSERSRIKVLCDYYAGGFDALLEG